MIVMSEVKKEMKRLEGKGELDYDYTNDILFFKVKNREYDRSIEADRFGIDIDKEGFVVGIQIFDASEFLRLEKIKLRQIKRWKLASIVDEGRIEIRIIFETIYRNKPIVHEPIITEPLKKPLPPSEVVCTV